MMFFTNRAQRAPRLTSVSGTQILEGAASDEGVAVSGMDLQTTGGWAEA
jgi:hypothetical protein